MPIPEDFLGPGGLRDPDTSHNRYSSPSSVPADTNTDPGSAPEKPREMSPYYLYSSSEMAQLLGKAEVTVRLEARKTGIGTKRDGRWYFNEHQKTRLMDSFRSKRRAILPSANIPLLQSMMQREDVLLKKVQDHDRMIEMMAENHFQMINRIQLLEQELKELRRKLGG